MIKDIKTLLTEITSNIYLNDMPDSPDNVLCINNTGGSGTDKTHDKKIIENPTFQIIVRNKSSNIALSWINQSKVILDGISNQIINGKYYLNISQQSDILSLGKDSSERSEYSINFSALKRR